MLSLHKNILTIAYHYAGRYTEKLYRYLLDNDLSNVYHFTIFFDCAYFSSHINMTSVIKIFLSNLHITHFDLILDVTPVIKTCITHRHGNGNGNDDLADWLRSLKIDLRSLKHVTHCSIMLKWGYIDGALLPPNITDLTLNYKSWVNYNMYDFTQLKQLKRITIKSVDIPRNLIDGPLTIYGYPKDQIEYIINKK